jgi:hypothetical protein
MSKIYVVNEWPYAEYLKIKKSDDLKDLPIFKNRYDAIIKKYFGFYLTDEMIYVNDISGKVKHKKERYIFLYERII